MFRCLPLRWLCLWGLESHFQAETESRALHSCLWLRPEGNASTISLDSVIFNAPCFTVMHKVRRRKMDIFSCTSLSGSRSILKKEVSSLIKGKWPARRPST